MLESVAIQNFRCLKALEVPLEPLTVLIGQDDTGKSTFLDALERLALPGPSFRRSDHWRLDPRSVVIARRALPCGTLSGPPGAQRAGAPRWPVGALPRRTRWPKSRRSPTICRSGRGHGFAGVSDTGAPPTLGLQGELVPALLDFFLRRDRRRFFDCVDAMRRLIPGLEELEIATPEPRWRRSTSWWKTACASRLTARQPACGCSSSSSPSPTIPRPRN